MNFFIEEDVFQLELFLLTW